MNSRRAPQFLAAFLLLTPAELVCAQGSLTPPGPPAPSLRTLEQIEPRRPVGNAGETLTAPGSYYLTGDLNGNGSVPGLTIAGPNITVDLNGFSIARTLNVGLSPGLVIQAAGANARIRNGRIRNWGGDGVQVSGSGTAATFEDLEIINNGGHGLRAGEEATVRRCLLQYQTGDGLQVGLRSRVEDCRAADNGGAGIRAGVDVVIVRSHGSRSGSTGIHLDERSAALDCVASSNASYGVFGVGNNLVRGGVFAFNAEGGILIQQAGRVESARLQGNAQLGLSAGLRSTVLDCTSDGVTGSAAPGIRLGDQSVLRRCTSTGASGPGFLVGSLGTVADCSATANGTGLEAGDSCQIVDSTFSGNAGVGLTIGSGNQVRGVHAGQNGLDGLRTIASGNRIDSCTFTRNSGYGLVVAAPGTFNQILRNTIAQNATGNLSLTGGQVVGPSIASGADPNFVHPAGNFDF